MNILVTRFGGHGTEQSGSALNTNSLVSQPESVLDSSVGGYLVVIE